MTCFSRAWASWLWPSIYENMSIKVSIACTLWANANGDTDEWRPVNRRNVHEEEVPRAGITTEETDGQHS